MQEHSQTEPSTHRDDALEQLFFRESPSRVLLDCSLHQRTTRAESSKSTDVPVPRCWFETTGERMFECACHDGNYGLEAILHGTREQEKQST